MLRGKFKRTCVAHTLIHSGTLREQRTKGNGAQTQGELEQ
jgi:hypothetical protein